MIYLIIAIILLIAGFCWYDAVHDERTPDEIWTVFLQKMANAERVWDENDKPIQINVESMRGYYPSKNLAHELDAIYNNKEMILRIVDGQLKFERKPIVIKVTTTQVKNDDLAQH
jgi:hypothetical protein